VNKNLDIIKMILEKLGEMGNNHVIGFGAVQPHYAKSTREILGDTSHEPDEKKSTLPDIDEPVTVSRAFLKKD
jgi:hypothetical protein